MIGVLISYQLIGDLLTLSYLLLLTSTGIKRSLSNISHDISSQSEGHSSHWLIVENPCCNTCMYNVTVQYNTVLCQFLYSRVPMHFCCYVTLILGIENQTNEVDQQNFWRVISQTVNESPNGSELRDLPCVDVQVDLSASIGTEQQCRAEEKVGKL